MAKKGMKRYEPRITKNPSGSVPILNGKAKTGKEKANPLIPGGGGKVYHSVPHTPERIPAAFGVIDNDLAAENLTNDFDLTAADLQDLM